MGMELYLEPLLNFIKNKYFNLVLATILLIIVIGVSMHNSESFSGIRNIISVPLSPVQDF